MEVSFKNMLKRYIQLKKRMGDEIKSLRIKAGLTQTQVAKKAEISVSTFGKIERGKGNAAVVTLFAICRALNVNPDALVFY
jgi:transcriptional regulator with XRE-family HTH domain